MGYCSFKIAAGGLSFTKTSYEKIEADNIDIFDFISENHELSDAEKSNMEKRQKHKVKSCPIEEFPFIYRTQKFALCKARRIIEISEYLLQVLKLAEKIVTKLRLAAFDDEIEKYIDVLREIYADKDDIISSRFCRHVQDEYTELIQTIPKDLQARAMTAGGQNKTCSKAVFLCLCKFLEALENEFFYFVTPEIFLNNPTGDVIFTLPHSLYRRFGFEYGGLNANERFKFSRGNPPKYAGEKSEFYSEIESELKKLLETAIEIKVRLLQQSDDLILENLVEKYEKSFAGQTCGKLTKLKRLLGNLEFREKLTGFFFEFRPNLINNPETDMNLWGEDNSMDKSDAKDACYFFHLLCKRYFANERIGLTEFSRLANLYSARLSPRSILSRNTAEFEKGGYSFSVKNRLKYEGVLET